MAGAIRRPFGDDVLVAEPLESRAIAGAAVAKKSLYELKPGEVGWEALKRALESADRVNFEILQLAHRVWGREK